MNFESFSLVGTALAQAAPGVAPKGPSIVELFALPLGFLIIMYFFIIRPQQRKAKEHQQLLSGLKVGDEVVTTGGIIGKVRSVADSFVTMESMNSQFKVLKSNVQALTKAPDKATAKVTDKAPAPAK